jgi:hypothetical protein
VVVGGTVVVVVGGLVVVGGGWVVMVVVGGTVLKMTPGFVTVVAGAGAVVVAAAGAGTARVTGGAVVAGAGVVVVVVVVVFSPKRSRAPTVPPRSPTFTVDGVGRPRVVVGSGRAAMTRRVDGDGSRAMAAITMARKMAPMPSARQVFWRDVLLLAFHHLRNRSEAGGRPKAAVLPMDGTRG